jgi:hypothetical protein
MVARLSKLGDLRYSLLKMCSCKASQSNGVLRNGLAIMQYDQTASESLPFMRSINGENLFLTGLSRSI